MSEKHIVYCQYCRYFMCHDSSGICDLSHGLWGVTKPWDYCSRGVLHEEYTDKLRNQIESDLEDAGFEL